MGGSVRVLYEQTAGLSAKGHDVHLLTRHAQKQNGYRQLPQIKIWKYATNRSNAAAFMLSSVFHSRRAFERIAQEIEFDIINFHQPISALGVLSSWRSCRIKKVYTCHSLSFEEYASRHPAGKKSILGLNRSLHIELRKRIERHTIKRCDRVVALSRYTTGKLMSHCGLEHNKIVVIPGGANHEQFSAVTTKEDLRDELNLSHGKVILFTVRNLVKRMGLENLVEAMKMVVPNHPEVQLIIGGEGPLRQTLAQQIRCLGLDAHIFLAGFIEEQALPRYYRMADLFVLPTEALEGFGLVTVEAMAAGLPVVGTPVGGTIEILNRFDPSFLFRDKDAISMAEKIREKLYIIKNAPEQWKKTCQACVRFTRAHYSWQANITALTHCYQNLLTS
jgi:glycosyltransferase involved in cell wall biosynthesis